MTAVVLCLLFAISALSLVSLNAQAGNINYNYVDLTYNSANYFSNSGNGVGAAASFGITDSLYIVGNL